MLCAEIFKFRSFLQSKVCNQWTPLNDFRRQVRTSDENSIATSFQLDTWADLASHFRGQIWKGRYILPVVAQGAQ